ncbi:MAG TPA: arylsulfotransferase family protein, partial [Solirubrobacteraceae bacterium]
TGLVRREWHPLDHLPLSASYSNAVIATRSWPFDYFHINSIDQRPNGTTLISARNTWSLYELNSATGQVVATIGGKQSSVNILGAARTAYQHDAQVLPNGTISIFDNGAVPKVHPQSRGLIESVNGTARTATLLAQFEHPQPLSAGSQGNLQPLSNGDFFIGWGSQPYFSEFAATGQLLFDAHMHGSYQAYRAYRFPWTGAPASTPSLALNEKSSKLTAYASWNGDTRTAGWQLLAGANSARLHVVSTSSRAGFETALSVPAKSAYFAVRALDASGSVIGTSRAIHG